MQMLKAGETAMVGDVVSTNRLRELGLQDGAEIQMVRAGECCIVRLGNRKIGFRADETANVLVRQVVAAGERA
jgi:Fe2+ transport system protein FeoA